MRTFYLVCSLLLLVFSEASPLFAQRLPFSELAWGGRFSRTTYRQSNRGSQFQSTDWGGGVVFQPQVSVIEIGWRAAMGNDVRFRFGELIRLEIGLGINDNIADGSGDFEGPVFLDKMWSKFGADLGAQAAFQLNADWEVGGKLYRRRIFDSARDTGREKIWKDADDLTVLQLSVRCGNWTLEPGLGLSGKLPADPREELSFTIKEVSRDYFLLEGKRLYGEKLFVAARYEYFYSRTDYRQRFTPSNVVVPAGRSLSGHALQARVGFRF